ncbi:exopolysaccharide biosynthesis polyprenyl glycosylphosphotransferase [Patescibacteria group bacterium]|nr:MAG: exopolysaccharide biosynthesis polyprenyl glycosylphosphotransferase [Patescibacteria group bacterium]
MNISNKKEPILLAIGDLVFLFASLWLMLFTRYGNVPQSSLLNLHLESFWFIFALSLLVFFIAGLYEKHATVLRHDLPNIIFNSVLANTGISVLFFYLIPQFAEVSITPKTNLFIYALISFGALLLWRLVLFPLLGFRKRENALIVGGGAEMKELMDEVNRNSRYNISFISSIDLTHLHPDDFPVELSRHISTHNISLVAIDVDNQKSLPILPYLYNLIFSQVRFIDMYKMYEDVFDRVPISLLRYGWFLQHISITPRVLYDVLKRVMDIVLSLLLALISLLFYPFVYIAIKLDDGGPIFIVQNRIGKNNRVIRTIKFRTMSIDDAGNSGKSAHNEFTRVGPFLRKTRIDELPQLWNVLLGDMSLIGPRPELPAYVSVYENEIPYYNVRHLIKPGLSGWAQLYQKDPPKGSANADLTRTKLSYDLYYIKNRSLLLDLKIALQTIKALLSRSGV